MPFLFTSTKFNLITRLPLVHKGELEELQVVELLLIMKSCFNVVSVNMVDFLSLGCCVC